MQLVRAWQAAIGEAFLEIVQEHIVPGSEISRWITPTILDVLLTNDRCSAVRSATYDVELNCEQESTVWFDCLRETLPLASPSASQRILSVATLKGGIEESVDDRVFCCKLLGTFAETTVKLQLTRPDIFKLWTTVFSARKTCRRPLRTWQCGCAKTRTIRCFADV